MVLLGLQDQCQLQEPSIKLLRNLALIFTRLQPDGNSLETFWTQAESISVERKALVPVALMSERKMEYGLSFAGYRFLPPKTTTTQELLSQSKILSNPTGKDLVETTTGGMTTRTLTQTMLQRFSLV